LVVRLDSSGLFEKKIEIFRCRMAFLRNSGSVASRDKYCVQWPTRFARNELDLFLNSTFRRGNEVQNLMEPEVGWNLFSLGEGEFIHNFLDEVMHANGSVDQATFKVEDSFSNVVGKGAAGESE